MANEKTLLTRIVNKHADYNTWDASSLVLKEGEIALAKLTTILPDGGTEDNFVAKIGTNKTFKESAWLYAKASDVYSWAKAATKPSYTATEIARDGSTVAKDLKSAEDAIKALQTAVGDSGSVATMIEAAVNALDNNDAAVDHEFVTAAIQTDGTVTVTRRALTADDIPELGMSKITGLETALAAKAAKTYVDEQDNAIKTTIGSKTDEAGNNTVYGAIATAKAAGDQAASDLADYETANDARVKAIEDDYTTEAEAGTIAQGKVDAFNTATVAPLVDRVTNVETKASTNATAIADLAGEGNTSTVKANADAIAKLREDIGNVANVMNFRGVSSSETVGTDITDPVNGDVIIHGDAEYVYNVVEGTGTWVKFGDASDNSAAISNLQDRVNVVETAIGAGGRITTAIEAAAAKGQQGIDDAKEANDAIAVLNGTGEGSVAKAVADAKTELQGYADTAEADAVATAKSYTDTEVKKASDAATAAKTSIDNHIANKSNPHEVTAEQLGVGDFKDKTVAGIKTEFTGNVADGNTGFVTGDAVYDAITAAKTEVKGYTDTEVKKATDAAAANATDIAAIEANYVRVSADDKLVYGQDEAEMVIIFDCGGAE